MSKHVKLFTGNMSERRSKHVKWLNVGESMVTLYVKWLNGFNEIFVAVGLQLGCSSDSWLMPHLKQPWDFFAMTMTLGKSLD